MSERSHSAMGLPGEAVLLLHKPSGSAFASASPAIATAAAEIGELALRHRVVVEHKKLRVLDASPTGVVWADELLEMLARKSGPKSKPIKLSSWLSSRTSGFKKHRARLVEHGLLRHERRTVLGLVPLDRYFADTLVRDSLVSELGQVARVERPIDNRLALLTAVVHATGLARALGFGSAERRMIKSIAKGEHLEGAVSEAIAATSTAIAASAAAAGAGGGGDGGGGGS